MGRRRFSKIRQVPLLQTAYTQFKQWEDRTQPTNYTRDASSNPGGYIQLAVTPFGGLGDSKILIKCSRRSNTTVGSLVGARVSETLTGAIRVPGFEPAKAIIFKGTGGTESETSKITNRSYKKRQGKSYTMPFGGVTGTEKEMDAQAIITAAVIGTPNNTVSFTPERLYQY